jgi:hypothetical protein
MVEAPMSRVTCALPLRGGRKEVDMGRGKRPPRLPKRPGIVGGGPGGTIDYEQRRCWKFALVRATNLVSMVGVGQEVDGLREAGQVLVRCGEGTLGYAPASTAREILGATGGGASVGRLAGQVIRVPGGKVWVELCTA